MDPVYFIQSCVVTQDLRTSYSFNGNIKCPQQTYYFDGFSVESMVLGCLLLRTGFSFAFSSAIMFCSDRTNTNPEEERYFLLRRVEQWFNLEGMCKLVVVLPIILYEN